MPGGDQRVIPTAGIASGRAGEGLAILDHCLVVERERGFAAGGEGGKNRFV